MAFNWRHKLIFLAGLSLLAFVGLGLRLIADQTSDSSASGGVPIVRVAEPNTLLPDDYPRDDVEMFGQLLNSWDEGLVRVIQYRDDFRLDFGRRKLSADSAVIWIKPEQTNGQVVKKFVIYLEGSVRITEKGGSTIRDQRHIVSLETVGKVWTDARVRGEAGGADSDLYRRAKVFRDRIAPSPVEAIGQPSAGAEQPVRRAPPPPITFQADSTRVRPRGEERVIVAVGNVYMAWADPSDPSKGKLYTEIRANRAVLFAREKKVQEATSPAETESRTDLGDSVTGVYLEGDVILQQGERSIQAEQLFYDREYDRALILDGVWFQRHESRNVPQVVWFERMIQLSPSEFRVLNGEVTSSEMATPQTSLKAREIYIQDRSGREKPFGNVEYNRFFYRAKNETARVQGVPLAWWPGSQGDLAEQATALRTLRVGYDSDFGASIETQWHLLRLLNLEEPKGWNLYLNLDAHSAKGPAGGIEGHYARDNYYGRIDSYLIWDSGDDNLGDDEERPDEKEDEGTTRARGRLKWQDRHYLLDRQGHRSGWELTGEFSYLSDRNFLEEYYESEYDTGKEQETHVYLKKTWDNNVLTSQLLVRINDFLNQTEKLPEIKYYKLGEPLWNNRLVLFVESGAAILNRAVDDERTDIDDSGITARGDVRAELQAPLDVGPARVVPYVSGRLTAWSTSFDPDGVATMAGQTPDTTAGAKVRGLVTGGFKSSAMISRTFNNVESRFWDVHRLRHLIKPEINLHLAVSTVDREELQPFDAGVESAHGALAANFSLRQRLQTKRGGPGAWRNVEWMGLDLEATVFANEPEPTWFEPESTRPAPVRTAFMNGDLARGEFFNSRPENSLASSTFNYYYWWRVSDTTTLLMDGNLSEAGVRSNIGLSVQRSPRLELYFGQRYIEALGSNDLIFASSYQLNRKYKFLFSYVFDTEAGETASVRFTVVRKIQRWYAALTFDLSETEDRQLVMITLWPEGAPEITIGKRQSGYGTTTYTGP